MKVRPWEIVVLGFLHLLEPIFRLFLYSFFFNSPVREYLLGLIYSKYAIINVLGLFLFPMAGISILMFQRWSLFIFLLIEFIVAAINFSFLSNLLLSGDYVLLLTCIALFALNIFVVTYFLFPSVRKIYDEDDIQWWKQKARYKSLIDCDLVNLNFLGTDKLINLKGKVTNISESGIFIQTEGSFEKNHLARVRFIFDEKIFDLDAHVVYIDSERNGIGAKFVNLTKEKINDLKYLIEALSLFDIIEDRSRISLTLSFKEWVKNIFKSPWLLLPKELKGKERNKNI
ncbi:MAG: PilZ domain-containing protein [Halobacteriovoraceae bacterium]|nr:PilZ domain-containing protein [Halobacteriovoraceae bacterium]